MLTSKPVATAAHQKLIKPRALHKGDTVGIIAPSSPPFEMSELEFTYQWLTKLGLNWKRGKHVFDSYSDYAGDDEARATDFMSTWCDVDIDAILPVGGGNGAARMLPLLDFELLGKHPKLFVGYSDITSLLIPIHQRTGLVCFHGPMARSFYKSSYTYHWWVKAVMSNRPIGVVTDPVPDEIWSPKYPPPRMVIAPGTARGKLTGGCLTLIKQLEGTPFAIETAGKIVFIEDLHEEPHAVDRMLTQLLLTGKLQQAAGILIGECTGCRPGESNRRRLALNHSLEQVLRDRLGDLGVPVVYGMRFGHGNDQFTLPLGVMAHLEAKGTAATFKIEEGATH